MTEQASPVVGVPADGATGALAAVGGRPWGTPGMILAAATFAGHAMSYGFSLVLSRALGPSDFGALGALLGIAVVASVPAVALQTQVARVVALDPNDAVERRGFRLGWTMGALFALLVTALAVPVTATLRLDSPMAVVWLGVGLVAASALGARQGVLLGRGAFVLLAVATVVVPALRLVSAGIAAGAGMGVSGAVGMQTAASWFGLLVVAGLVRTLPDADRPAVGMRQDLGLPALFGAAGGLLGLFTMASLDVLLARTFLSDEGSGLYAMGAIAAKVVFWGSQFLALLVFPRVARRQAGRELVLRAGGVVVLCGALAALAAVLMAGPVLDVVVGSEYAGAAGVAPWFVVLGTMLGLIQLLTYAGLAEGAHRFSVLIWIALCAQAGLITLVAHASMEQILAVSIACTGLLAATGAVLVWRGDR